MEKFKYHRLVMNPADEEFDRLMSGLGADGWELVAVVPSMGADPRPVWVFKREWTADDYYEAGEGGWALASR